jgi:hypothetical protein
MSTPATGVAPNNPPRAATGVALNNTAPPRATIKVQTNVRWLLGMHAVARNGENTVHVSTTIILTIWGRFIPVPSVHSALYWQSSGVAAAFIAAVYFSFFSMGWGWLLEREGHRAISFACNGWLLRGGC